MRPKKSKENLYAGLSPCEMQLCLIVWNYGTLPSSRLRELCKEQFGWSKSTMFTYIRRLTEKGILVNEDAMVRILVTKESVLQARLDLLIAQEYEGSPTLLFQILKSMYSIAN